MKRKIFILIQVNIFLLVSFPFIVSAGYRNLSINLHKYREIWVQDDEGNTEIQLQEIQFPRPGDILRYTFLCENKGDAKIRKATIINPIPAGTIYLPEAISKDHYVETLFSIDGGKTYQLPPIQNTVITEQGKIEIKEVPPHLYTHIQWLLEKPLCPNECQKFYFKVKVNK